MKCISICFSLLLYLILNSCINSNKEQLTNIQTTDSLSNALNAPELKEVNALLLAQPENAELYFKRAQVYFQLKQLNEAINDSKRAIKLDSTKANYYLGLVDVYFSQNNTRLAKELLEITAVKFPGSTEALLKLAELYFLVKHYQQGIDYANKALKIDENLAKAYYIKGSIHRESGDTMRAISSLETAIEQDIKFEDAFYDLGLIYAARKSNIGLEYYNSALKLNPTNKNTLYARAKLLQDLGKTDEAITEYLTMLKNNPDCENCYYNLGALYLELKKEYSKAQEYFTKAIEINPNYIEAYYARGYTYTKLKDKTSARADFKMCLKLQANYEPAIEALNEL